MITETDKHIKETIGKKTPISPYILEMYGFEKREGLVWRHKKNPEIYGCLQTHEKSTPTHQKYRARAYVIQGYGSKTLIITNVEQLEAYMKISKKIHDLHMLIYKVCDEMDDMIKEVDIDYEL